MVSRSFAKEVRRLIAYGERRHLLASRFNVEYKVISEIDNLTDQEVSAIPEVPHITNQQFSNIMSYCCDKKWITKTEWFANLDSWKSCADESKDIYNLEAYLMNICKISEIKHLL